ncbi:MAG: Gfo/Idh/MocA family oxidoreductase, partial [Armatimonadetes bacterium]|nr:Gfo/Idh/MocA family oxidoreductase [Armatimonadota bacterium]
MSIIRIAIAGCGSVSWHYLNDLKTSAHAQVVAVCDVREERARERAEQFGIPQVYTDLEEMLQRCEFDMLINLT